MILKTLDNALQVLNYFTKENNAWGVRELARELNTSHTVINKTLKTFEKNGFLTQDPESKKYYLGLKFIEFSHLIKERMSIVEEVFPMMQDVSEDTKESIFLTWRENNEGVTLAIAESTERIKFSVSIGTRTPLYIGASCKSMMAYLGEEKQLQVLDKFNVLPEDTTYQQTDLYQELDQIKQQGWCYTCGEYSDHVFGLSVPLFDKKHQVIASLTIAGPEYRIDEARKNEMLVILKLKATEVQQMINHLH